MDTYKVITHGIYSSHIAKAGRSRNNAYSAEGQHEWSSSLVSVAVYHPDAFPRSRGFHNLEIFPVGATETFEEFDLFLESVPPTEEEMEAIHFIDTVF